jgi:hypothetical protein
VLRAAQWAIDGRQKPASVQQFRVKLAALAEDHLSGARDYSQAAMRADRSLPMSGRRRTICLNSRAEGLAQFIGRANRGSPKLVVTSPPYPGVHVLYHRWQVQGGKETPAPFWIANRLDGAGEAYYLMHARRTGLNRYHAGLNRAFSNIAKIASRETVVVQLVAFSDPIEQLPRYLSVMGDCGFREYLLSEHVDSKDGRIWRKVPGRRWHANRKGELSSGTEVVLIHKPA